MAMRREIILQRFSVTQLNTATNVSSFHFACIRGHLLCFSIDSGQIFLNKSFRKSLSLAKTGPEQSMKSIIDGNR